MRVATKEGLDLTRRELLEARKPDTFQQGTVGTQAGNEIAVHVAENVEEFETRKVPYE
jgi:hypothetical protein